MKEFKQINMVDSIGKTIKKTKARDTKLLIVFNDDSFVFFERYSDYDSDVTEDVKITLKGFTDRVRINSLNEPYSTGVMNMFIECGLLDFDELCVLAKDRIETLIKEKMEIEINHLKHLKLKYPTI